MKYLVIEEKERTQHEKARPRLKLNRWPLLTAMLHNLRATQSGQEGSTISLEVRPREV